MTENMPGTARVTTRRHRAGKVKTRRTMSTYQRKSLARGWTVAVSEVKDHDVKLTRNVGPSYAFD